MNTHYPHIACILASGLSNRFGDHNKLLAEFKGMPMIAHVANAVCDAGFDKVYAIVNKDLALQEALSEFDLDLIINEQPEKGQSESIKLAANTAIDVQASTMTIALGDMPFITKEHLIQLKTCTGAANAVVSYNGEHQSPPVLFKANLFVQLSQLEGDQGALVLLKSLTDVQRVQTKLELLRDIDTPQILADYS